MSKQTLEQRITIALGNSNAGVEDLSELIAEVEAAAIEAAATAEREKEKALDLVAAPDAAKAHERVTTAVLNRGRLNVALPKLCQRLAEAAAAERRERWLADYKRVEVRRNAAAEKLARTDELLAQVAAIYREASDADEEIARLHGSAPNEVTDRLASVELYARGTNNPSLIQNTRLFDWSGEQLWPPPQPSFAATYAASMIVPGGPRYTGDWWRVKEEESKRSAEAAAAWQEQQAERDAAERRRFEQSFRTQR